MGEPDDGFVVESGLGGGLSDDPKLRISEILPVRIIGDSDHRVIVPMLTALHIKNVVLIEQLSLSFSGGLSALTGETGAGKSILLDSLGLALGARAETSLVRRGSDQASVSAEFGLSPEHPVRALLDEQGISVGDELILRRTLGADGRSRAFINDESVSVGFLKMVGETLVDIHGQFETYGLLNPATHRIVLDQYAGNESLLSDNSKAFRQWKDEEEALLEARAESESALRDEEYVRACCEELESLAPAVGEETELIDKKKKIQHVDTLRECFSFIAEALGGEAGADMQIGQACRMLSRNIDKIGDGAQELLDTMTQASETIQDAHRQLDRFVNSLDFGGLDLESIEDRLYALRACARKHHCTVDELPTCLEDFRNKLALADRQDDVIADLERRVAQAKEHYGNVAEELHQARVAAAGRLDKIVNAELGPLKLDKALFETSVEKNDSLQGWGVHGFDEVRFLVATNTPAGEHPVFGPLNKIASGGEMARFMLALKVVLADSMPDAGVFVFDEIDTGIGGATASAVGERLAKLAKAHQVMVVTHSPQVAACAVYHWVVSKAGGVTQVTKLDGQGREEEIARMLSGSEITGEARAAAAKLMKTG